MLGTHIRVHDNSQINPIPPMTEVTGDRPVVLSAFASRKGPEGLTDTYGEDFVKLYGQADFKNYGQISVQNQRCIEKGARIVGYRIVAEDATLANLILVAKLYKTEVQKVNSSNEPLYYDTEGEETTEVTADPVMISTAHIRYEANSIEGVKSLEQIEENISDLLDDNGTEENSVTVYSYPLYIFTDNGRGNSIKRFRISPDTLSSKSTSLMLYTVQITESGDVLETERFGAKPDAVLGNKSIELDAVSDTYLKQVKAKQIEGSLELFVQKLSELSLIDEEELLANDFLFGTTRRGNAYRQIKVDTEDGIDLSNISGLALINGTNGTFGNGPFSTPVSSVSLAMYNSKLEDFFGGVLTPQIWNTDRYKIDVCFDACFPTSIKNKIIELAKYRQDFLFIADLGTNCYTMQDIESAYSLILKDKHCYPYCQAYNVIDPYTQKTIKVSIVYSISSMLIDHLRSNRAIPFAGENNGAIITEMIPGSLTFEPVITPNIDEKTQLEDLRINFGSYLDTTGTKLTIETLYTAQDDYTQLSFANNMLAMQRIFKVLRSAFPATRYQHIASEEDISKIEDRVNEILSIYGSDFILLQFRYVPDNTMLSNKVYKAEIEFQFKEFTQAEIVDAYVYNAQIF